MRTLRHWWLAGWLLIALAAQAQPSQPSPPTQRYEVVCVHAACGELVATQQGSQWQVSYQFKDNGRGPELKEWIQLDAAGTWPRYRAEGVSTYGAVIRDEFERQPGGSAQWRSRVDAGEQASTPAPSVYLAVDGSPWWLGQLTRALRDGQPRPALPAGEVRAERVLQHQLRDQALVLYAVHGLDLAPVHIWLRAHDGAFFAQLSPGWGGTIWRGFAADIPALEALQQQARNDHLAALARRLAHPLPGLTVIRQVRWFDAPAAQLRGPADVFVYDGRIAAIQSVRPLDGLRKLGVSQVIDGQGRTLLPGLVDMHSHVDPNQLLLNLAAGVTAVRDLGNSNADLAALKARIDSGEVLGPRIAANGLIEGKSPFSSQSDFVPDTLGEALAAIDWYAAHGYRQLKLYNSIRPEWVKPMAAHARQLGLRVGGHVPAFMTAAQAVQAGYRELHHINQVTLNFLVGPQDDTRTLLRFTLPGDRAHTLKLDDARTRDFIALLRRTGTVVDPTAVAFEAMYLQRQGSINPSYAAIASHLPASLQRGLRAAEMEVNDGNARRYSASWAVMMDLVRRMHAAGVPLVAGTDATPGFAMQRELELYAEAGIPVPEVLRIATWNGAKHSDRAHEIGAIERGKLADLILIDGNPVERLADIRRVALVIQGGVALAPDELYAALSIRPFVPSAKIERP